MKRLTRVLTYKLTTLRVQSIAQPKMSNIPSVHSLNKIPKFYMSSSYPKHQILDMPALSPTMSEGKIVKWNKNVGDKIEQGDIICQIETDKATVGFQSQSSGYLAYAYKSDEAIPVGQKLIVVVSKKDLVDQFKDFSFNGSSKPSAPAVQKSQKKQQTQEKPAPKKQAKSAQSSLPKHQKVMMPALSPTMAEGKIAKWNVKVGEKYGQGDALCEVETDKATVTFEATQSGIIAKIIGDVGSTLKVGELLAISVSKSQFVDKFSNYQPGQQSASSAAETTEQVSQKKEVKQQKSENAVSSSCSSSSGRIFASPAAKRIAEQKNIPLSQITGSGPQGRILQQDVQSYKPGQKSTVKTQSTPQQQKEQVKQQKKQTPKPAKSSAPSKFPENPFTQTPLNNMRKTIAARLTESKTTIPHYYINLKVQMDKVNVLRNQLNKNEKQNGVKISVNDIIVKAMALALRDYPAVNSQWTGTSVKQFKYADVSVAVATQGGLITPIVYRADTLGLLDIAKRTKDIAKRARQGKLDPRQYQGGCTTVSNLGMFGINSVISVINPPQSTIIGVGKTEKQIVFDEKSIDAEKPYRVAQIMELTVSADHRVVDGALAAQWLTRIKKYLQNPTHMLL